MKKIIFGVLTTLFTTVAHAQIEGKWKTIDDETGKAKSVVEIYKTADGKYNGKIVQLLTKPSNDRCVKCSDDRKDKPLIGMDVIRGLKKKDDEFSGGTITDPQTGKTYKCQVTRKGNELNVRGYFGISLVGRSQTWHFVK